MKTFEVGYKCLNCNYTKWHEHKANFKSEAAAEANPILHTCSSFSDDPARTQGIAHAFAIREKQ